MYVIVGLGNQGDDYRATRHNAGRIVVSAWVLAQKGSFVASKKYHGDIWEGRVGTEDVLALLPATYMNESGGAVRKAVTTKKQAAHLIVLHDDLDLPLGTIRIGFDRGAGGHNGVRSIIQSLGTQTFIRIRIGISPSLLGSARKPASGDGVLRWVMSPFTKSEAATLAAVAERVGKAIEQIVTDGLEAAMNEHNRT